MKQQEAAEWLAQDFGYYLKITYPDAVGAFDLEVVFNNYKESMKDNEAYNNYISVLSTPDARAAEEIRNRIKFLSGEKNKVLQELNALKVGGIAILPKWDLLREILHRINELEILLSSLPTTEGQSSPVDAGFKEWVRNDWEFIGAGNWQRKASKNDRLTTEQLYQQFLTSQK